MQDEIRRQLSKTVYLILHFQEFQIKNWTAFVYTMWSTEKSSVMVTFVLGDLSFFF